MALPGLLATNHGLVDVAFARYNPLHPRARSDLSPHLDLPRPIWRYNFRRTLGHVRQARCVELELGLDMSRWQPNFTDQYRSALTWPDVDSVLCSLGARQYAEVLARAPDEGPLLEAEERYPFGLAARSLPAIEERW